MDDRMSTERSRAWRALVPAAVVVSVIVAAVGVTLAVRGDEPAPRGLPVLVLAAGSGGHAERAMSGIEPAILGPETQYRLVGPLPDLGRAAPVARLLAPADSEAVARRAARALGLDGEPISTREGFRVEDPTGTLELVAQPSGTSVSWTPGSVKGGGTDPGTATPVPPEEFPAVPEERPAAPALPEALPSAAEAERIARGLLSDMGIATAGWEVDVTDAQSSVTGTPAGADEQVPSVVFQRMVTLRPVRDEIPVHGLEWYVTVGDLGRIDSVWGMFTDLEDLDIYPLRSTTEAFEDLQAGRDVVGGVWAITERVQEPAIAPADPTTPVTVDVHGVRHGFVVIPRLGNDESKVAEVLLVPTYEFLGADGSPIATVIAVTRGLVQVESPSAKDLPVDPIPAPPDPTPRIDPRTPEQRR